MFLVFVISRALISYSSNSLEWQPIKVELPLLPLQNYPLLSLTLISWRNTNYVHHPHLNSKWSHPSSFAIIITSTCPFSRAFRFSGGMWLWEQGMIPTLLPQLIIGFLGTIYGRNSELLFYVCPILSCHPHRELNWQGEPFLTLTTTLRTKLVVVSCPEPKKFLFLHQFV